jgi:hypothetical protein
MARVNLFEGSRRIALFVKVVWVLGVVAFLYADGPSVRLNFETAGPDSPFTMVQGDDCRIGSDASEYFTRRVGGNTLSIQLCFRAHSFEQQRLVPYKVENGTVWGNERYSTAVTEYTKGRAEAFRLTPDQQEAAIAETKKQTQRQVVLAIQFAIGGWVVLSALQYVIGWIVRGFMGIPHGQDHRASQAAPSAET